MIHSCLPAYHLQKMNDLTIMRKNAEAALRAIMDTQTAAEDQSRSTITALRSNIETLSEELDKETKAKQGYIALSDDLQDDVSITNRNLYSSC